MMPAVNLRLFPVSLLLLIVGLQTPRAGAGVPDAPFPQLVRLAFVEGNHEENDVRSVVTDRFGRTWVATRAGLRMVDQQELVGRAEDPIGGPAYDVAVSPTGDIWVGAWNGVYHVVDDKPQKVGDLGGPIVTLAFDGTDVLASGPAGLRRWNGKEWQQSPRPDIKFPTSIRGMVPVDGEIAAVTDVGFVTIGPKGFHSYLPIKDEFSRATTCVALVPPLFHGKSGEPVVWVGTNAGVEIWTLGTSQPKRLEMPVRAVSGVAPMDPDPRRGMYPCAAITSIAFNNDPKNPRAWLGTEQGVILLTDWRDGKPGTYRFLQSRRWLPSDEVRDITVAEDGTVWVATAHGLAILQEQMMTLAEKAAYFEKMVRDRHVRAPGLVERCMLREPGNLATFEPFDTDNDGEYTGTYIVAEAYRYAATGSKEARQNAVDSFKAMEFLQTVTGTSGFIARTVVPSNWTRMADPNRSHTPQERAEMLADNAREKIVERRWRLSDDLKWLWKGDTSSDEITGHLYTYAVFYDLVADEQQKKDVAQLTSRVVDYIIDGGYVLRDIDGAATLWGVWSPEKLNGDPDWANERGINSVEILSYLTTARHMTGDDKYDREIKRLLEDEGYAKNILSPRPTDVGGYTYIDDELIAMAYRALLLYEKDPKRLALYRKSADTWFDTVRRDASPCYNYIYAELVDAKPDRYLAQGCVDLLRDVPLDMIHWTVDNSRREDLQLVRRPQAEQFQTDRLLPPSENCVLKWDHNPYLVRGGEGGHAELCPAFWLWGYWMGRYHGYITEVTP